MSENMRASFNLDEKMEENKTRKKKIRWREKLEFFHPFFFCVAF